MYGLVGLLLVTFCSLACAQERHECVGEAESHKLSNREHPILHNEPALKWIPLILVAVTREVEDGCFLNPVEHRLGGSIPRAGGLALRFQDYLGWQNGLYSIDFFICEW